MIMFGAILKLSYKTMLVRDLGRLKQGPRVQKKKREKENKILEL